MIKLVASDLDGTLLTSKNEVDDKFWEIFQKLKRKNILFAIISGRQYYSILEKFEKIKDEIIIAAENGTYILYKGKELYSNPFNSKELVEIQDILKKAEANNLFLCGKKATYTKVQDRNILEAASKFFKKINIVSSFEEIYDEILKIAVYEKQGIEKKIYDKIKNNKNKFYITLTGYHWLDIMRLNSNKGKAIEKIEENFGIKNDEILAFGDHMNDYEMIEKVKYGVAMENSHSDLKKIAKIITKSNDEHGVIEIIEKYILKA